MSRVTEIYNFVKRDLAQFVARDINAEEYWFALNKGQEKIIMLENFLDKEITIDMVAGTSRYPLVYGSNQAIVKKIRSITIPDTWGKLTWLTPQQFGEHADDNLRGPFYVTVRYGSIEFNGAPYDTPGKQVKLGVLLSKQSRDADNTYDPEVPSQYDTALRFFCDWYLLPIDHPQRENMFNDFEKERKQYEGILNNTDSFPRSPEPTW